MITALERMLAMRSFMRSRHVDKVEDLAVLKQFGLTKAQVEDMYHVMALANYEDRFVIPTSHRAYAENAWDLKSGCGFSFGNGCSDGNNPVNLFGGAAKPFVRSFQLHGRIEHADLQSFSRLLDYPTEQLHAMHMSCGRWWKRPSRFGPVRQNLLTFPEGRLSAIY